MPRRGVGGVIYKQVRIRVFGVENKTRTTRTFTAPPGKGYNHEGIGELLDGIADDLDTRFPQDEWRMVDLAPNKFNFVWHCKRETPPAEAVSDGAR